MMPMYNRYIYNSNVFYRDPTQGERFKSAAKSAASKAYSRSKEFSEHGAYVGSLLDIASPPEPGKEMQMEKTGKLVGAGVGLGVGAVEGAVDGYRNAPRKSKCCTIS